MKKCFPALDDLRIYKWQNRKKLWFNFTVDLYIAMMKETNREKGVAGEASSSSSRRKRQRLASVAEDEGRGVTASVDEDEAIPPEARSGTLLDLDLLDCPVCLEALTKHVFQVSFISLE